MKIILKNRTNATSTFLISNKNKMILIIILIFVFFFSSRQDKSAYQQKVSYFLIPKVSNYTLKKDNLSMFEWRLEKIDSGYTWKKKIIIQTEQNHHIDIYFYEYNSIKKCYNAYQSLIDCFPTECLKLEEGKNLQSTKTIPSLVIINRNSITIATTHCISKDLDLWNFLKKALIIEFKDMKSKILQADCGGPIEWILLNK